MWWQYALAFLGSFLLDVAPFPLPPAFTVMIFLQLRYDLNLWVVVALGVLGSILGRYVLTRYVPHLSGRFFTQAKNDDARFLGAKLKKEGWKGQLFLVAYCLLPLPSTPLFLAAGMGRVKPIRIIPAFIIGKFTSDLLYVLGGEYAVKNSSAVVDDMFSFKSIASLVVCLLMVFSLLFVDWHTLLRKKELTFKFDIWNRTSQGEKGRVGSKA
jgi:membrane protein YqaA with SNARE-associated domain